MKENPFQPPKWAERFLSWYCKPELLEDLQGDLHEYFERNVKLKGQRRANWIYIIDVIKFLKFYTIRKPEFINLLIQWIMIGSYIKTSGRNMVRNKLFSAINIVGLAISMSVGLLLISLLSDMLEYDRFHEKGNRIYRVNSNYKYLQQDENTFGSTSLRVPEVIKQSVPEATEVTTLYRGFEGDITASEKTIPLYGYWASGSFFDVFTFPLIEGNARTALKNPFSIVLTEKSANKLFGHTDVLGKAIIKDNKEFIVTAVAKDIPVFSHLQFDMLASLSSRQLTEKERWDKEMSWSNIWNGYTYIILDENTDLKKLQTTLDKICSIEDKTIKNASIRLQLQPLNEIALGKDLNNSIGYVMDSKNVWMIGILTAVVMLSACFNYTNLSIARSLKRAREVGIRKVSGALKGHVITQFIVEAVVIALIALAFSFLLFQFLKPQFLSLNEIYNRMLVLDLSPKVIVLFILFAITVGVMAGFFPSLFFSRFNAIQVLKNNAAGTPGRMSIRKGLIVAQFSISLMFIASTIIGYKYYKQVLAFDLGFKTKNVANISLWGNKSELLRKELAEIPEIKKYPPLRSF